jgi:F-type H+-transporting ATPase subunit delta
MRNQILVRRYTQGLASALGEEKEYLAVSRELAEFSTLLQARRDLADVLASPFIAIKKKQRIIMDILAASSFSEKTKRFIGLLFEHNRLPLLGDILQAIPVFWNERRGVSTFEASSVVALTVAQKSKLKAQLERLEKRPVDVTYTIEPGLVAGISLKKGNIVYDASIRGHLSKLKEKISEG